MTDPSTLPWDAWGDSIVLVAAERGIAVNLYRAPSEQIAAPGIVLRPDTPWMTAADSEMPFARTSERWAAVCIVSSGDPISNQADLRNLARLARDAADAVRDFRFTQTTGITSSESDGVEYLATVVRATFAARD